MITHVIVALSQPVAEDAFSNSFVAYLCNGEASVDYADPLSAEQVYRTRCAVMHAQRTNPPATDLAPVIEALS